MVLAKIVPAKRRQAPSVTVVPVALAPVASALVVALALGVALALLVACFTLVVSPAAAGVKLSDVVQQAKKPPEQQEVVGQEELSEKKTKQPVPVEPTPPPAAVIVAPVVVEYVVLAPAAPSPFPYYTSYGTGDVRSFGGASPSDVRSRVGTVAGGGGLLTENLGGYGTAGMLLGFGTDFMSLDVRGFRSSASLSDDLSPAMRGFDGWAGDLALRLGFVPRTSSWGVNILLAGRRGRYGWDYQNPVTVVGPGGSRVVDHDSIGYTTFLTGLGFEPVRRGDFSLGITMAYGVQFFKDGTRQGFENDLFEDRGLVEMTGELVYSPSWK